MPHKICFRCSAKLEELYEFIQKCIKTQENLRKALGNRGGVTKSRHVEIWQEKLNQSNISNDDICEAVIKKAMEGIRDIPKNPLPLVEEKAPVVKKVTKKLPAKTKEEKAEEREDQEKKQNESCSKNEKNTIFDNKDDEPVSLLRNVLQNDAHDDDDDDEPPVKRKTRLSKEKVEVSENKLNKTNENEKRETSKPSKKDKDEAVIQEESVVKQKGLKIKQSLQINNFSLEDSPKVEPPKEPKPKPFDIMEHVSMIKVNGVGVLFQCKLCNRNFLKKEVVMTHACAKQGAAKVQNPKTFVPPEPPKIPQTVKYITINKDASKSGVSVDNSKSLENQKQQASEPITLDDDDDDDDDKPLTAKKPAKPKIGPASKVRRSDTNVIPVAGESSVKSTSNQHTVVPTQPNPTQIVPNITATITSANQAPSVQFPTIPSLNSRYKLMPGPNNSFTLVEDNSDATAFQANQPQANTLPFTLTESNMTDPKTHKSTVKQYEKQIPVAPKTADPSISRPYPVGLITAAGSRPPLPEPPAFPTPAMKKQSYTVVQTGNPSKLLISTKPQPPPPVENVPRKRSRKSKNTAVEDKTNEQPFSVTIEDATPPTDPRIFTFINVDPLLQPSYVLPTDNIIQESQISTSTNVQKQTMDKDSKYTCNMCNEKFSREKKLLAHIQSHYKQMDEEDEKRADKNPRKRGKK